MSRNARTPESRGRLGGRGSVPVPVPVPVPSPPHQEPGPEANAMKDLLREFKALYDQRLMYVQMDEAAAVEQVLQNKVDVLQSYVNDLVDQNQVLVQTIEDLQKEADHKVSNVGMKPHTSDGITDVCEVELRTLSLDELVGPLAHVPQHPDTLVQIKAELEDLKLQLRAKEVVISALQKEQNKEVLEAREKAVHLQSEMSCVQQIQIANGEEMAEKDISIAKLHAHIELLQQREENTHTQLSELNMRVRELLEEVKRKEEEWRLRYEEAEERRGQEQRKREEEWRRRLEEERRAHTQAAEKWDGKEAALNSELEVSRKHEERQSRELLDFQQKEESLLSEVGDLQQRLWDRSRKLDEAQRRSKDSLEDGARLRARLDAHRASANSQHQILTSELGSVQSQRHALEKQLEEKEKELESVAHKAACLESSLKEAEESCAGAKTEVQNQSLLLEEMTRELERLSVAEKDAVLLMKKSEQRVRHLDHDAVALRATQDSLKRTMATTEKQAQQLVQDNSQLKGTVAALKSKFQTSECAVSDIGQTLDQARTSLILEKRQRQQIQDQLDLANKEVERLQQELTQIRRTTEKKIQKREVKVCALVKELTESKKQHLDCHKELLNREKELETLRVENNELRAKTENSSKECVQLNQSKDRLEKELAQSQETLHASHLEVRSRDQLILHLRAEMKTSEQKHHGTQGEMAALEAEVTRLNRKVRGHQEEASQLREKVRGTERLREQKEEELHSQLSISQQRVKALMESIGQLNSDLEAVTQAHKIDAERRSQANVLLHSQLEQNMSELSQIQNRLERRELEVAGLKGGLSEARTQKQIATGRVEASEGLMKKQKAEMELLHQHLKVAQENLKEASLQAHEQKESVAIFKQKYTAAMEKVHRVQGQVEMLEEELRYSQRQLRESQAATCSAKEELDELERRYQEKVGQWESSQGALDQLTEELQANQNLLMESQQRVGQFEVLTTSLQEQVDTLKQQKLVFECELRLYQQSHSHSDEEFLSLRRHRQQLQKRCTEQAEHIAECEKAILQMKSELERRAQEKEGLTQSLVASHCTHLCNRGQLEQEVTRLDKAVARLDQELADTHKVHVTLLRQSEEHLSEAKLEAARTNKDAQRLKEELQREEEKMRSAFRENLSLSAHARRLSHELEELRRKHQLAVEELAAHAEEARRMEGCLSEGKLAEEKIRSIVARLEKEVTELRKNLRQAVDQRVEAEREKKDAREQVDVLRLQLEGTRSENANLCHESQLVMTNVKRWITEQKHLQEANDTLTAAAKRLQEVAEGKEREVEHFKAQMRDRAPQREERTRGRGSCVALNLGKIENMQARLRSNLEAIGMLNQQMNTLSGENERLRRQLEEERSAHKQGEPLFPPPPTSQRCSAGVHLPPSLRARPPPSSTSRPSSRSLPRPLSPTPVTGDNGGTLTGLQRTGRSSFPRFCLEDQGSPRPQARKQSLPHTTSTAPPSLETRPWQV
ncbi:uncharacterized protein LOC143006992 [Genypterus blacodes]|uniref:uncharacterized protein LOC143006992 n=1 Tax=Genypterus blacodes TaxID=154954 RepID=UPI003F772C3A